MKRRSLWVGLTLSFLMLAAGACVGDDPTLAGPGSSDETTDGGGTSETDGSGPQPGQDGATPDDDSGVLGDGGGDAGDPAPHIPVVGHYFKSTNPVLSYAFGSSIALSVDGNTMAVGSPGEDSAATGVNNTNPGPANTAADYSGAVFVFTRSGGVWTQQAYLKASNTAANANFGHSVSLSSDGNRLAVGARGESTTQSSSGAVYMFQRTGTNWTQTGTPLKAGAVMQSATFGSSVALSGDGNMLAVGSFGESGTGTGIAAGASAGGTFTGASVFHGAVNVFAYNAGSWAQTHYIKPSVFQSGGRFGSSVALNGAGNVLIVGAQGENSGTTGVSTSASTDTSATGAGAAYVFEKNLGAWSQTAYVKASNTRAGARFGVAVSVAANGESFVVGSSYETSGAKGVNNTNPGPGDTTATNAGAAYVFTKSNGGVWGQTAYVKASNTRGNSYFGGAVALSLDGKSLIVGASPETSRATGVNNTNPGQDDTSAPNAGAAYVYALVNGDWMQTAYLKTFTTKVYQSNFGASVAITNAAASIAVGASTEQTSNTGIDGTLDNTSASGSGAAFTFE